MLLNARRRFERSESVRQLISLASDWRRSIQKIAKKENCIEVLGLVRPLFWFQQRWGFIAVILLFQALLRRTGCVPVALLKQTRSFGTTRMLFRPRGFTRYVHCSCRHTMPRSIARRGRGRGSRRGRGGARRRRSLPNGSARVSEPKKKVQTALSFGQEDDSPPLTGRTRIIVDPHGHDDDDDDDLTADRSRASGSTAASKPSESVWVPGYRELPVTPEPGSPFRRPSSPLRAPTEALGA